MHAVLAERLQPRHQRLAGVVEVLEDRLQPFGRHRFDADERAANPRAVHRLEELGVLGRFHRDLGVEHQVVGQLLELRHQLEALLRASRCSDGELRLVGAAVGRGEVGERHRIEVVVGEQDEAEALAAQLDDLADDRVDPRCRGFWPSVRHTEQNEQCFGQPRTVCTEPHM